MSVLGKGAGRLLAQAVEAEAEAFPEAVRDERGADAGGPGLVRHGPGP